MVTKMGKVAEELKEEQQLNESLRKNQAQWQDQLATLKQADNEKDIKEYIILKIFQCNSILTFKLNYSFYQILYHHCWHVSLYLLLFLPAALSSQDYKCPLFFFLSNPQFRSEQCGNCPNWPILPNWPIKPNRPILPNWPILPDRPILPNRNALPYCH